MEFLSRHIDFIIFGTLGFMGFVVITLGIERVLFFLMIKVEKYKTLQDLQIDVSRNLTTIGVIGSNAPYVGLLGTVVGIIIVFYDMGRSGNFETATIMTGLSTALYATALGLVVAIPSLVIHSFFIRKAQLKITIFERDCLENRK
ncbi:TonB-system energizer ExbB [Campylobacter sp. RM12327]|uniref:TonB-system energizer ExbB n=1 Tax=Campylobacter sputorum subsp. sputorum TaxID=32024 RepID=A0A381DJV2_9BACT|nr:MULTISPECIES: TonB-system energizer ExbB [Campylobacter]ASM35920.1 TonB system transport protein ExbB [Campylobacter sputorum aubsp. sputorum RM3237]ASM37604.1 TonB system transport protein ExbB [Campylobacter sputorum bv. faecalis CCUG 20703]ASM39268.1 TonB system transport protein ExbB [Campylobacter sputorum bv. paraureolyticus LMG 11764]ASM40851.1 TonB system transport protein ExbB [Campylobacter sputorum]KAB0582345.1 TonB-system energizer ExbB [Campylobacter sputorum subsp. sputorum]